ncbi:hypothetical protein C8R45DRAFT_1127891 [Mycena sanguinolenta]|nr:hypothetical protein C8R45DRAFT_1127891 [Mycena sanguinolenta]
MPRLCTLLTPVAIAPAVWRQDPLCLASPHLLPSDFTTSPPAQTRVTMIFLADDATQDPRRRMSSLYSKAQREARRSSSSVRLPPRLPAVQGDRLEGGLPRGSSDGDTVLTIQTKHTLRYVVWVRLGWGKQMVAGIQRSHFLADCIPSLLYHHSTRWSYETILSRLAALASEFVNRNGHVCGGFRRASASRVDPASAECISLRLRLCLVVVAHPPTARSVDFRAPFAAFRGETLCISTLEGDEEEIVRMLREALSSSHVPHDVRIHRTTWGDTRAATPRLSIGLFAISTWPFPLRPTPFHSQRSDLDKCPSPPSSPLSRSLAGHGPLSTSSNAAIETCSWRYILPPWLRRVLSRNPSNPHRFIAVPASASTFGLGIASQDDAVVHAQQDEANALDIFPPRDEGGWDVGRDESDRVAAGLVDDATFVVGIPHQPPVVRVPPGTHPSGPFRRRVALSSSFRPRPPRVAFTLSMLGRSDRKRVVATNDDALASFYYTHYRLAIGAVLLPHLGLQLVIRRIQASYAATVEEWVIANDKGDNARIPGTKTPSTLPASSMGTPRAFNPALRPAVHAPPPRQNRLASHATNSAAAQMRTA